MRPAFLFAAALSVSCAAAAATRRDAGGSERRFRELVRDLWNRQDLRAAAERHWSAEIVHEHPWAIEIPDGLVTLREEVLHRLLAFPDLQATVVAAVSRDDQLVARVRFTGRHEGTFLGVAPTDRSVTFEEVVYTWWKDGRVVRYRAVLDLPALATALGVHVSTLMRGERDVLQGMLEPGRYRGGPSCGATFLRDGDTLLTATRQGIVFWSWRSGKTDLIDARTTAPAPSRDGQTVLWADSAGVHRIRRADRRPLPSLPGPRYGLACARELPDGSIAATDQFSIVILDASTGERRHRLHALPGLLSDFAVSPDGREIAAGTDGEVRRWLVQTGAELPSIRTVDGDVSAVAWAPDGKILAFVRSSGDLVLWSLAEERPTAVLGSFGDRVWPIAFSPDSRRLAVASEDRVDLIDAKSNKTERSWKARERIHSLDFSPDGGHLAVGTRRMFYSTEAPPDLSIEVFEVATARLEASFLPPEAGKP